MAPAATELKPVHRERTPIRYCAEPGCGAWLTSANEDAHCARHGGWIVQRFSTTEAREDTADLLRELMGA